MILCVTVLYDETMPSLDVDGQGSGCCLMLHDSRFRIQRFELGN